MTLADLLDRYPVALLAPTEQTSGSTMTAVPRLGAAGRSTVAVAVDGQNHADDAQPTTAGGRPMSTSSAAGRRIDYGFLLDDDDRARARPAVPPATRRGPRAEPDVRPADATSGATPPGPGGSSPAASIYELHIGTFTPDGTLDAAIDRLDHLVDLGIDFVELLPVNAFNGDHNWGYDGVLWYAVQESYGGPAAYQRFVDACHQRGLAVIQDVVYNHLGPSGNYLPLFGPYLHDDGRANTWGASVNLDGPIGRGAPLHPRQRPMWLRDYHVDGLRLDAVHALVDTAAVHLLEELAERGRALSAHLGRPLTLIAESDLNDPTLITPRRRPAATD